MSQLEGMLDAIASSPNLERGLCIGKWAHLRRQSTYPTMALELCGRVPSAQPLSSMGRQPPSLPSDLAVSSLVKCTSTTPPATEPDERWPREAHQDQTAGRV